MFIQSCGVSTRYSSKRISNISSYWLCVYIRRVITLRYLNVNEKYLDCSYAYKVRFLGDEFNITNTFESIKTLSMRILLYRPVPIQLYPSDTIITVYSQTFQQ